MSSSLLVLAALRLEAWSLRSNNGTGRVWRTGMGPRRAQRSAARFRQDPAEVLAVAGFGGALDPALAPGAIVIASALVAPDGRRRSLDPEPMLQAMRNAGLSAHAGVVASAERTVTGVERERLAASGACAVDMESWWLAEGAAGRPFTVVRIMLDGPQHELWRFDLPARLVYCMKRLRAVAPVLSAWAVAQVEERRHGNSYTGPTELK